MKVQNDMTLKICFLDRSTIRDDIIIRAPDFNYEWMEYQGTSAAEIIGRLEGIDIVITNKVPIDADILTACPKLKMVTVAATGTDHIDLDACHKRGVVVSNIRNYALTSVPEHVISMMLMLRREVLQYRAEVIKGRWQQANSFCFFDKPIHDLAGATLGIIGFGALGQATARMAHTLGMKVIFHTRSSKQSEVATQVDLNTLLQSADIISCHCALTPDTHHLLNAAAFAQMKPNAIVINAARGAIVDEAALAHAIKSRQIAAAGIDVLPKEPPAIDSPLMKLAGQNNVILTPHIAWASQEAMQALSDQLIDNIESFVASMNPIQ